MIQKIKTKIKRTEGTGIFHDSRTDVINLGIVVSELISKINELVDKVNELEKAQEANGIYL